MDDFRFEELRVQLYPQSGADTVINIDDKVTRIIDRAVIADIGGVSLIIAGRPQPPVLLQLPIYAPFPIAYAVGTHFLASALPKYSLASVMLSKNFIR